jgi:ABC-2 type transport system ATP-binding protein
MSPSSTAVVAISLTKLYGNIRAIDGVSFEVERGEVFSLLGPNGAGKTTTIEILECLRTPTSGEAYIMGLNIRSRSDVGKIKRIIGVLPQEFSAVDNLTVYENVLLAAAAKGVGKSFRDLLEGLGLWEVRGRLFSKLSGGMKRKVGLAMALVGDPEVVFLDEPTTGLDPQARREAWRYLLGLRREGRTIILTTHYMEEAERLSDRVAIMVSGRIAMMGRVPDLVAQTPVKARLVIDEMDEALAQALRSSGYSLESLPDGRWALAVKEGSELEAVLSLLERRGFRGLYEVRAAGLEDIFLSTVGSRISERGDLV